MLVFVLCYFFLYVPSLLAFHLTHQLSGVACRNRFFAGGSERSGQQIVGPPKKKSSNEVVEDLFKGAKEHGAVPLERSGKGSGEPSRAQVRLLESNASIFFFYFYFML